MDNIICIIRSIEKIKGYFRLTLDFVHSLFLNKTSYRMHILVQKALILCIHAHDINLHDKNANQNINIDYYIEIRTTSLSKLLVFRYIVFIFVYFRTNYCKYLSYFYQIHKTFIFIENR